MVTYRFGGGQTTPIYRDAVRALRQVALSEGLDRAQRAVADALAGVTHLNFLKGTGATESRVQVKHWRRLIGERPIEARYDPVDDHCSLWNRERKPWAYISQPYHLETHDLREIVARCDHGLTATVRADVSWYFPGGTLAVIWTRQDSPAPIDWSTLSVSPGE